MLDPIRRKGVWRVVSTLLPLLVITLVSFACRSGLEDRLTKARTLIDEGRYEEAVFELKECLAPGEGDARPLFLLGLANLRQGKLDHADAFFRQAIALDPLLTPAIVNELVERGNYFVEREQEDRGVASFERALALDPYVDLGAGFRVLGDRCFGEQRFDEAVSFFERALSSGVEGAGERAVRLRLAQCHETMGDLEAALRALEASSDSATDSELLWERGRIAHELAKDYLESGRYTDARRLAESVIEMRMPEVLIDDAHFVVGETYFLEGDYRRAIAAYEEVLRLNPIGMGSLVEAARRRIEMSRALQHGD